MKTETNEILQQIRKTYQLEGSRRANIKLPGTIAFKMIGQDAEMHIPAKAISANMQDDNAAFEGWALGLKRWGKFNKIILSWDCPENTDNGHYQRFLFRVEKFTLDFASWFSVAPDALASLQKLKIKENGLYFLNSPSGNRKQVDPRNEESILEKRFVSGDWTEELKKVSGASYLTNQLPVGVFDGKVSKANLIFTGGKSAIDMLGIDEKNRELLLFELKKERNNKIGIISELYLYSCILRCVQDNQFKFEKSEPLLENIARTTKIDAIFLAPGLHPLIDKQLISVLNFGMKPLVSFRFIQFTKMGENVVIKDGFDPDKP